MSLDNLGKVPREILKENHILPHTIQPDLRVNENLTQP